MKRREGMEILQTIFEEKLGVISQKQIFLIWFYKCNVMKKLKTILIQTKLFRFFLFC